MIYINIRVKNFKISYFQERDRENTHISDIPGTKRTITSDNLWA